MIKMVTDMPAFKLLSLNSFGIPFYLGYARLKHLAVELNQIAPTVICLQEVQQNAYLPVLRRGLVTYPHLAYFRNQFAPKGGLFTASYSTCKVIEHQFYPFLNQGRPISIGFSDYLLNKGALLVKVEVQDRCFVVINTHLQANYRGQWHAENSQTQIQLDQVSDLVKLIEAQPKDAWVIICGDFNFPRQSPAYERMMSQNNLIDALVDDPRSTYQPFPLVVSKEKWAITLDYLFYRVPPGENLKVTADILPVENTSAKGSVRRFLSDHKALVLEIG
jgi:endonuclease/exonuclease/phosphatase family metal-dependent hydrolase